MACPYFMPVEKLEGGTWPHPRRLPLGAGWSGHCTAPGHIGEVPTREILEECCNLGYGNSCERLPPDRECDAVRFGIGGRSVASKSVFSGEISNRTIAILYVCELQHRPKQHGTLEFDPQTMRWLRPHADSCVQRMAECFLDGCLGRRSANSAAEKPCQTMGSEP